MTKQDPVRILLIEDEPPIARLTTLLLQGEGYSVEAVSDQQTASMLLTREPFDLIITDTDSGARTASLSGLAPLIAGAGARPVILFSAHRFPASMVSEAGLAGSIAKPYDIDDLLKTVSRILVASSSKSEESAIPSEQT
ncbi:MAG: response regulator [Dehalococcoidia bacterium]